jgi:hypothetical protein
MLSRNRLLRGEGTLGVDPLTFPIMPLSDGPNITYNPHVMINPRAPQWIVYPRPRRLKVPFSRSRRETERVVTFDSSPFLVELDEKRLPKGVACVSSDPAKQHYTFRLGRGGARTVIFNVSATKAENATGVLSAAIQGEAPERSALLRRIRVYNLDSVWNPKLISLALDMLNEVPSRWRWLVVAAALFLLMIAPPWDWTNPRLIGIRAGVLPDLTQDRFDDDFQSGLDKWHTSGNCAGVQTSPDNFGRPVKYLHMSSPCYAIAKLRSGIEGFHPVSQDPAVTYFWAELGLHFESSNQVTILLHARPVWFWLRPFLPEKLCGDRLSIERLPQPSKNKLRLKLNCSSPCPQDQTADLGSSTIQAQIKAITVYVYSLEASACSYYVEVLPDANPLAFDEVNGVNSDRPRPKLRGSSPIGSIGFLGTQHVDPVTIKLRESNP